MTRPAAPGSDNDSSVEVQPRKSKGAKTKTRRSLEEEEDVEMGDGKNDPGDDAESEEAEEEYEIEAILSAEKGRFPEGRMGYYVKWKGYSEADNSWVDEADAGNAQVLIDEFWRNQKKGGRKSLDPKSTKRPRKLEAREESDSVTEKKGIKKTQAKEDADKPEDPTSRRAAKKPRRAKADEEEQVESVEEIGSMERYTHDKNWESLVERVDTVERAPDNTLWVYFTLSTGERVKERSRLCAQRFPQKLIIFYEENLRWRAAEEEEQEDAV